MAIIQFAMTQEDAPADARWNEYHKVWTWETHKGLCIRERESNGYSDSDFYMTIWDGKE